MKTNEITVGKMYEIKTGKSTVIATVVDLDKTDNSWNCETASGKLIVVKQREMERFLAEVQPNQTSLPAPETETKAALQEESMLNLKNLFAKASAAKIAAQHGFCTQEQADAIVAEANAKAEQLTAIVKEKTAKANAAKIAAEFGFCATEVAESLAKEASDVKSALRSAGRGVGGGHIRSGMSGLEAAYKILSESGEPMNAKTITKLALEQGIWNPQGATPDLTLSAALQNDVKKKGEKSRFAKASQPGHYIVREMR